MESLAAQSFVQVDVPPLAEDGGVYPVLALGTSRCWITNPNHHLWLNNGTSFFAYTVYPTPFTNERIRSSQGTQCAVTARRLRNDFFAEFPRWAKSCSSSETEYSGSVSPSEDAPSNPLSQTINLTARSDSPGGCIHPFLLAADFRPPVKPPALRSAEKSRHLCSLPSLWFAHSFIRRVFCASMGVKGDMNEEI